MGYAKIANVMRILNLLGCVCNENGLEDIVASLPVNSSSLVPTPKPVIYLVETILKILV
jgi:hypothetical protein